MIKARGSCGHFKMSPKTIQRRFFIIISNRLAKSTQESGNEVKVFPVSFVHLNMVNSSSDIQLRKIAVVEAFLDIQREDIISRFEALMQSEEVTSGKISYNPMSFKTFENRINSSLEDSANDRVISTSDLLIELEEWD
jgi:hypothetical protein